MQAIELIQWIESLLQAWRPELGPRTYYSNQLLEIVLLYLYLCVLTGDKIKCGDDVGSIHDMTLDWSGGHDDLSSWFSFVNYEAAIGSSRPKAGDRLRAGHTINEAVYQPLQCAIVKRVLYQKLIKLGSKVLLTILLTTSCGFCLW